MTNEPFFDLYRRSDGVIIYNDSDNVLPNPNAEPLVKFLEELLAKAEPQKSADEDQCEVKGC